MSANERSLYDPMRTDQPMTMDEEMSQLKKRNGKRKALWCLIAATAVGGAATVLGGIWWSRLGGMNLTSNAEAHVRSGGDLRGSGMLEDHIASCKPEVLQTGRRDACQQACDTAECCHDPPPDATPSCLNGNEDLCGKYKVACKYLSDLMGGGLEMEAGGGPQTDGVPPPPHNLDTFCGSESLATLDGFRECEQACAARSCCEPEEDGTPGSCAAENEERCKLYEICDVLDSTIDNAGGDGGADDAGTGNDNVINSTFVEEICSAFSVQDERDRRDCAEICSDHMCCFQQDDNCVAEKGKGCVTFDACKNLLFHEEKVVLTSQDVDERCGAEIIANDLSVRSDCAMLCSEHMCCFEEDDSCAGAPDKDCPLYSSCQNLFPVTPHHVAIMCSEDAVKDADRSRPACSRLCSDHMCCFEEDTDCPMIADCATYDSCKNLLVSFQSLASDAGTSDEGTMTGDQDPGTVIGEVCSTTNLADEASKAECAHACSDHMCCFEEDNDCSDDPAKNCALHSACKNLLLNKEESDR